MSTTSEQHIAAVAAALCRWHHPGRDHHSDNDDETYVNSVAMARVAVAAMPADAADQVPDGAAQTGTSDWGSGYNLGFVNAIGQVEQTLSAMRQATESDDWMAEDSTSTEPAVTGQRNVTADRAAPEVEGHVLHPGAVVDGPRCYAHDSDPVHLSHGHSMMFPAGVPAHTWTSPPSRGPGCCRCGGRFDRGDRYLCEPDGIVHVTCPPVTERDERGEDRG